MRMPLKGIPPHFNARCRRAFRDCFQFVSFITTPHGTVSATPRARDTRNLHNSARAQAMERRVYAAYSWILFHESLWTPSQSAPT